MKRVISVFLHVALQAFDQKLPGGAEDGVHVLLQLAVRGQQEEEHEGPAGGDQQPLQQHQTL